MKFSFVDSQIKKCFRLNAKNIRENNEEKLLKTSIQRYECININSVLLYLCYAIEVSLMEQRFDFNDAIVVLSKRISIKRICVTKKTSPPSLQAQTLQSYKTS